jgi:metal-dependent amidase/aminoacylase/carboxypeptidase family protein
MHWTWWPAKLAEWRIELHRGVGRTGVVGVLRSGNGEQAIGLRPT